MRHLDQHWLAWPVFLEGELSVWGRLKLRLAGSTEIVYLDSVYPPTDAKRAADYLECLDFRAGEYVLFSSGGGYQHAGVPAPEIFAQAATEVCRGAGIAGVWVRGPNYSGDGAPGPNVVVLPAVATHEMIDLLSGARVAALGLRNGVEQAVSALERLLVSAAA